MNERIQELISQSKRLPYEHNVSLESFAELIVRECAKVADGGWADPGHQIKQHFGVEL